MEYSSPSRAGDASARGLLAISWTLIVLSCVAVFYANLRFREKVLAIGLEDDFFYYAQAARNLAFSGHSTFDGVHLTNGYHPLWFLIIAVVTKFFAIGGQFHAKTVYPFAIAIESIQTLIVIGVAYLTYKICSRFCSQRVSICVQLLTTSWTLIQIRTGMETGLAIMMILALIAFRTREYFVWNANNCLIYGQIASIAILSRLDVVLVLAPVVVVDLLTSQINIKAKFKSAVAVGIGLSPLMFYFFTNMVLFNTIMPISGTAKQLRAHHVPSTHALHTFMRYMMTNSAPLLAPCVLGTVLALIRFRSFGQRIGKYQAIFLGVLLFPIAHLLVVTSTSDWQIFPWYLYPWVVSMVAAAVVLFARVKEPERIINIPRKYADYPVYACASFLIAYGMLVALHSSPSHNLPYQAAMEIRSFERTHPGVYAMGDRAGVVGYFGSQSVVQLEGLMMDKDYLENIRAKKDLLTVLHRYGVKYYVATRPEIDKKGCFYVKEPWQAGPDSPAMTAKICQRPVAEFSHQQWTNDVFELSDIEVAATKTPMALDAGHMSNPTEREGADSGEN